ncbi:hypothetical protein Cpir12675_006939 [Ceratocystis pirilliformis]|uniref:AB hydrolase-1 domain-containing protein n=1 Tax=Ceratocystis pirilliformis TaxID=259994 RepID=A0ABR3YDG7_9PEZI
MTSELPPVASASMRTITMAGLAVDVYGLEEISPSATRYSLLWLHHARTRDKSHMTDFANRMIAAWTALPESQGRAVICSAFDQRNHGTRLIDKRANKAWKDGNETHAQDMVGGIVGMVTDTISLIDVIEGYLFPEDMAKSGSRIDQHMILGKSLGGHTTWQALFKDPRITVGVAIVGCPDFMRLMKDRAQRTKLPTYDPSNDGVTFLGSKHFPPDLVAECRKYDPRGVLFGTTEIPDDIGSISDDEKKRITQTLVDKMGGKKVFVTFGGQDKLVPYSMSKPFLDFLSKATASWGGCEAVTLKQKVYEEAGHVFTEPMVLDSLEFLCDVMKEGPYKETEVESGV